MQKSKEVHPDKHMNNDEDTVKEYEEKLKELLWAYKILSTFILKNKEIPEEDLEEEVLRKEFENINVTKMNQNSVTLLIPKSHTKEWIETLIDKFGSPLDQTDKGSGLQFKTPKEKE